MIPLSRCIGQHFFSPRGTTRFKSPLYKCFQKAMSFSSLSGQRSFSIPKSSVRRVGYHFPLFFLSGLIGSYFLEKGSHPSVCAKKSLPDHSEYIFQNPELNDVIKKGGCVLDLSECTISKKSAQELVKWLTDHHHRYLRVIWGDTPVNTEKEILKVESEMERKRAVFEERPSPYVCVELSRFAYNESFFDSDFNFRNSIIAQHINQAMSNFGTACEELPDIPSGWEVFDFKRNHSTGYVGVCFINHITGQMVLSHKGTDSLKGLLTDFLGVIKGEPEHQQSFAKKCAKEAFDKANQMGYRFGIVGHSLGGWLAQLTAAWCHFQSDEGVYSITMDTPGVKGYIKKFLEGNSVTLESNYEDNLDITNFLSLPNMVNTCNSQIGDLFHIIPDANICKAFESVLGLVLPDSYSHVVYEIITHLATKQIAAFDRYTGLAKERRIYQVSSWPEICNEKHTYFDFIREIREAITLFGPFDPNLCLNKIYCDRIHKYNPHIMKLAHFSPSAISVLKKGVLQTPDNLRWIEMELGEDRNALDFLSEYELDKKTITCTKINARKFHRYLELLVKIFAGDLVQSHAGLLSFHEIQSINVSQKKELNYFCESLVFSRLYPGSSSQPKLLEEHKDRIEWINTRLNKKSALLKKTSSIQGLETNWVSDLEEQILELKIMEKIAFTQHSYFNQNFLASASSLDEILSLMDDYLELKKSKNQNFPRFMAPVYALKGKVNRALWKTEKDLEKADTNYKMAIDDDWGLPNVPAIRSNYGAFLVNWGEWLDSEGRGQEAIKKFEDALIQHQNAYELSLKGEWFYQDVSLVENDPQQFLSEESPVWIRSNLARARFLLEKAKFDAQLISKDEYQISLELIKNLSPSIDEAGSRHLAVLFLGIIWEEQGNFEEALKCYQKGLEIFPNHTSLLNRVAGIYEHERKWFKALEFAQKAKKNFEEKKVLSPEDQYRFDAVKKRVARVEKKAHFELIRPCCVNRD